MSKHANTVGAGALGPHAFGGKKKDWRACPECGEKMDYKATLELSSDGGNGFSLYQCPKCKNIEAL